MASVMIPAIQPINGVAIIAALNTLNVPAKPRFAAVLTSNDAFCIAKAPVYCQMFLTAANNPCAELIINALVLANIASLFAFSQSNESFKDIVHILEPAIFWKVETSQARDASVALHIAGTSLAVNAGARMLRVLNSPYQDELNRLKNYN